MTWVAVAIGGGTALGVGGSVAGGLIGANASRKAAGQQEAALYAQLGQQQGTQNTLLNYFDPFRSMGLQAGQALTGELYSPQQQMEQAQSSLQSLNNQLAQLERQNRSIASGEGVPIMQGDRASERRQTVWNQMSAQNQQQRYALKDQIASTQAQLARAQEQAKNPSAQADLIQGNPMYTASANAASRRLAAQGLQGSQEAIRQEGTLASDVYQKQIANQLGIYQPTVGASANIAGMLGNLGQAQAQTLGGIGQVQAQGTIGSANAWGGAVSGAANAGIGGGGALLNYSLYNKLIGNLNTGNANTGPAMPTGTAVNAGSMTSGLSRSNWNNYGMGT